MLVLVCLCQEYVTYRPSELDSAVGEGLLDITGDFLWSDPLALGNECMHLLAPAIVFFLLALYDVAGH